MMDAKAQAQFRQMQRAFTAQQIPRSVTAAATVQLSDYLVACDATSAGFTLTLPSVQDARGMSFLVVKTDSSANVVTIDGSGSETINGATTQSLSTQWARADLYCDGVSWYVVPQSAQGGPRSLFDHYTDAATSSTGETDLYSDTIPAGTLAANGDKLVVVYGGNITAGTASRRWDLYFGGTIFPGASGLMQGSNSAWTSWGITFTLIRVSASVVRGVAQASVGAGLGASAAVRCGEITGLTLANTNVLKLTASENNGAQPITARLGSVEWHPAA